MERAIWISVMPTNHAEIDSAGIQRMHTQSVDCGHHSERMLIARLRQQITSLLFSMGMRAGMAEIIAANLYDGKSVNREQEIAPGLTISVYPCDPDSGVNLGGVFTERVGE